MVDTVGGQRKVLSEVEKELPRVVGVITEGGSPREDAGAGGATGPRVATPSGASPCPPCLDIFAGE